MELSDITPLVLSFNEAANIRDTLEGLTWAERIVMVDSYSSDATLLIASEFPQVEVFQQAFKHFADQCNFGLQQIDTKWTLSLDADYKCSPQLANELRSLGEGCVGYRAEFRYCVYGKPLRGALYPPRAVLYQTKHATYHRDGHAHRVVLLGDVGWLRAKMLHDDRKPLSTWLAAQASYAVKEAEKLSEVPSPGLSWQDRMRKWIVVAPVLTMLYCLFGKGLILDGWRGLFYTLQRTYAELLLSLVILDGRLRSNTRTSEQSGIAGGVEERELSSLSPPGRGSG